MGMRAGILAETPIGLDLGEPHRHIALASAVGEEGAEKLRGDLDGVPGQGGAVEHERLQARDGVRPSASDRTRAVSVASCSATRSGAVPPSPVRLPTEPETVSTSRTAGVR